MTHDQWLNLTERDKAPFRAAFPTSYPGYWTLPPIAVEHVEAFRRVQDAIVKERLAAREKLTEEQIIEAFRQAIACGDFTRLVAPNGAQGVIYVPFREVERLKARILDLERELDELRDSDRL